MGGSIAIGFDKLSSAAHSMVSPREATLTAAGGAGVFVAAASGLSADGLPEEDQEAISVRISSSALDGFDDSEFVGAFAATPGSGGGGFGAPGGVGDFEIFGGSASGNIRVSAGGGGGSAGSIGGGGGMLLRRGGGGGGGNALMRSMPAVEKSSS